MEMNKVWRNENDKKCEEKKEKRKISHQRIWSGENVLSPLNFIFFLFLISKENRWDGVEQLMSDVIRIAYEWMCKIERKMRYDFTFIYSQEKFNISGFYVWYTCDISFIDRKWRIPMSFLSHPFKFYCNDLVKQCVFISNYHVEVFILSFYYKIFPECWKPFIFKLTLILCREVNFVCHENSDNKIKEILWSELSQFGDSELKKVKQKKTKIIFFRTNKNGMSIKTEIYKLKTR